MCFSYENSEFSYVSLPEAISIKWFSVSSCLTKAATVRWKPRRSKPTFCVTLTLKIPLSEVMPQKLSIYIYCEQIDPCSG